MIFIGLDVSKISTALCIEKNNKVIKLEVELKILTTQWGKIIKNILESDIDLKLYQNKDIEGQIDNFYF